MARRELQTLTALAIVLNLVTLAIARLYFGASMLGWGVYDDAFITYRYARNVADGHGLVYNVGEFTVSASSPIWTLVLSASYRLGFEQLERVGSILGLVAALAAQILALALGRALDLPLRLAGIFLIVVALSGPWVGWAVSGMDGSVFGAAGAYHAQPDPRR